MRSLACMVLALSLSATWGTDASKVVVYQFPPPVPTSHFMLLDKLTKELATRGHTILVTYPVLFVAMYVMRV